MIPPVQTHPSKDSGSFWKTLPAVPRPLCDCSLSMILQCQYSMSCGHLWIQSAKCNHMIVHYHFIHDSNYHVHRIVLIMLPSMTIMMTIMHVHSNHENSHQGHGQVHATGCGTQMASPLPKIDISVLGRFLKAMRNKRVSTHVVELQRDKVPINKSRLGASPLNQSHALNLELFVSMP